MTIGKIAGFCDICHESMFGYEQYYIGKYSQLFGHESCMDEFFETEEGINWNEEEKRKEAEEKERQKQEKLKSLIKFKTFGDPFDQLNPLHDYMKFECYSKDSDENGNKYWIIYVSKDVADKLTTEQNRLEDEKRKAAEKEQKEIQKQNAIKRIKIIAYWSFYIIIGLVFAKFFFNKFRFITSFWGKIAFFVFLVSVPFLIVKIARLIFKNIRGY